MRRFKLKDAARRGRRMFTAWTPYEFRAMEAEFIAEQSDVIATTRSGWDFIQPTEGVFDFTSYDNTITLAQANGMAMRGQPFMGSGSNTPTWLQDKLIATPASWQITLEAFIDEFFTHLGPYPPFLWWEVVNEVMSRTGTTPTTAGIWHDAAIAAASDGTLAAHHCFNYAASLWPHIPLIINDGPHQDRTTNALNIRANTITYVTAALAAGVPLAGVGMQMHLQSLGGTLALDALKSFCASIAALGLPIYITEFDCRAESGTTWTVEQIDYAAARTIEIVLKAITDNADLAAVGTWGLIDDHATWVPDRVAQRLLYFETTFWKHKRSANALARGLSSPVRASAEWS